MARMGFVDHVDSPPMHYGFWHLVIWGTSFSLLFNIFTLYMWLMVGDGTL
jgi:hypothetical protein